jgi:ATP adenylyltransferase
MRLERLWAGWRASYIDRVATEPPTDGCLFCSLVGSGDDADDELQILDRNALVYAVLNAYPYTAGHLLVAPVRHEGELDALDADEAGALMEMTQVATAAVRAAYQPDGINIGMNLGRAAGAGIPGHLHVHVLPRWSADTNFMTSIAEARVLPEPLSRTYERLRSAWRERAS